MDITDQLLDTSAHLSRFIVSGRGIQLRDGRLLHTLLNLLKGLYVFGSEDQSTSFSQQVFLKFVFGMGGGSPPRGGFLRGLIFAGFRRGFGWGFQRRKRVVAFRALLIRPLQAGLTRHRFPAGAHAFDLKTGALADYKWSSFCGYMRPTKRPGFLTTKRVLNAHGFADDTSGRSRYRNYMKRRIIDIAHSSDPKEADEQ